MNLCRARLRTRRLTNGMQVIGDQVPVGKMYEIDLHRKHMIDVKEGQRVAKVMVVACLDGNVWGFIPLEVLDVEVPSGLAKA